MAGRGCKERVHASVEDVVANFKYMEGRLYRKNLKNNAKWLNKPDWWEVEATANPTNGYCNTRLHGKCFRSHYIVWVLHNGEVPKGMVLDHINGVRYDNRIENLRIVSQRKNCQNRVNFKNGVYDIVYQGQRKYAAKMTVGKTRGMSLGRFDVRELAEKRYMEACRMVERGCTEEDLREEFKLQRKVKTSQYLGVRKSGESKWEAYDIPTPGAHKYIGIYPTEEEAYQARCKYLEALNDDF